MIEAALIAAINDIRSILLLPPIEDLWAKGTMSYPGGLGIVGERGPELVRLPGGAQIYPNNSAPTQAALGGMGSVSNVYNYVSSVTYNYSLDYESAGPSSALDVTSAMRELTVASRLARAV
jgi:hypothetical protein